MNSKMKRKGIVFSIILVILAALYLSLAQYFDVVEATKTLIAGNTKVGVCASCHNLGMYLKMPRETLCSSCHEYRWAATSEYVHEKHVQEQNFDCKFCHSEQENINQEPINVDEVTSYITKYLDQKFPGDWQVSGTTLQKGSYTENGNYRIAKEVAGLYKGSMVSIYVGQTRISSSVTDPSGRPLLAGYPTPDTVAQVMKSGKAVLTNTSSIGIITYQKIFMPIKAKGKTVAVMSVSIVQ